MAERGELYKATDGHVEQAFFDQPGSVNHLRRTANWVEELKLDADKGVCHG